MGDDEAVAAPAKKGGGSMMMIVVILLVLLLLGGGAAAYFMFMAKPAPVEETEGKEKKTAEDKQKATLGATMQLDPFVVNLMGSAGRYLKIVLVLQLSTQELAKEVTGRAPQIKDSIITVLSSKSAEEILTIQGKYDLKVDLVRRINSNLTSGVVKELYFTEFVIQ